MNFNDFTDYVAEKVTDIMGEEYTHSISKVTKNNNIVLTGLSVRKEGERISPTVYLEDFYKMYEDGSVIGDVISEIAKCFKDHELICPPDISFIEDFGKVREKLMLKTSKILS